LIKFRHIFLSVVLVLFGWALIPPKTEEAAEEAADAIERVEAKYVIRVAPGVYMPGRRPQDVGEKLRALLDVAREFEKLHPDTKIQFVEVPQSREYLVTQLMGEQAPEIMNINVEDVWQDVQKGWYVPLDGYLEQPNPFVESDAAPGSREWWDMFRYQAITRGKAAPDGKMYCITLDMIETGVFYNKDIFRKVGVEPPRDWSEFMRIQERLKQAGYMPMLVDQGALADWGVDLVFDQYYRSIRPALDLKGDPRRDTYQKGYLDWDEVAFLNGKGFFTKEDPRFREVFRTLKDWRQHFPKDIGSVSMERLFITQKGAMYWSSSFLVNKLARDPNLGFEWGVFYLPPITQEYSRWASGVDMCVIGGAATQLSVTNSAFDDTKDIATSQKLKRTVAFLQFLTMPNNAEKVINEVLALLPNIEGVKPRPELETFAEILERDYTTTKWLFTFDLRFNEIMSRMFFLYLQDGISEDDFMDWMDKNVRSASQTVIRRKKLDLGPFEEKWSETASMRQRMEGLPIE
jgi:raffinose/stachyose/melibiose transport system substrate-binding protein